MIVSLRLQHFKGFKNFVVHFGGDAVLIGPNNAGKSTIISALRLCSYASRTAMRVRATVGGQDGERWVRGHPLRTDASGFVSENLRHEFEDKLTRLTLTFASKAELHLVWPVSAEPFFWVEYPKGLQVTTAAKAKDVLDAISLVPTLGPLEHAEKRLSDVTLHGAVETRLFSRHFRNHIAWIRRDSEAAYQELIQYLLQHTPELATLDLVESLNDDDIWLDFYFRDQGSRTEKELFWAGDGLQIWLQILFHLWRTRAAQIVVLDEPDVFLHPDLQRRLSRQLEDTPQQTILATHAPEIASEAQQANVVWVERRQGRAKRITDDSTLAELGSVLGSGFSLSVAKALRSKVALFVEGLDMKVLRSIAKQLKLQKIAGDRGLTVIPIGGFSRWPTVEAFAWIKSELLGSSVEVRLLLDRDYRSQAECRKLEQEMKDRLVSVHIWRRKELESYLLVPALISRVAEAPIDDVAAWLAEAASELAGGVEAQFIKSAIQMKPKAEDVATAVESAINNFNESWTGLEGKISMAPAKDIMSGLNGRLQRNGHRTVSARRLASGIRSSELDPEMIDVLNDIEFALS